MQLANGFKTPIFLPKFSQVYPQLTARPLRSENNFLSLFSFILFLRIHYVFNDGDCKMEGKGESGFSGNCPHPPDTRHMMLPFGIYFTYGCIQLLSLIIFQAFGGQRLCFIPTITLHLDFLEQLYFRYSPNTRKCSDF